MSDLKPFTFDWHAEPEGFLKWLMPTVLAGTPKFEEISQLSSKFSDVQLRILVNGVEVDAGHFLESVERNMEHHAKRAAREMLDEVGGLDALEERIGEIRTHLMDQFEAALRERGIELPDRDEWS